jgi:hypothetical protein
MRFPSLVLGAFDHFVRSVQIVPRQVSFAVRAYSSCGDTLQLRREIVSKVIIFWLKFQACF